MYLGDSAAYLFGAMDNGRLPDDRSFTYSFLIRGLVRPFESLSALMWWQTVAGVAIAVLMWHVLVSRLGVSHRSALMAACVLAVEPAQLYYERMVLAEAPGLLSFMMCYAAAAAYVASGRWRWLPVVVLAGLAAASLRLNYLPVVVALPITLPFIRAFGSPRREWRRLATHAAAALMLVVTAHGAYQQWVAWIFKSPPGYIARTGFMQLGLVLPLVQPEHLARVGLPANFPDRLAFRIDDPDARMSHMWAAGGFIRTLREQGIPIEPLARPLARMAIADDPAGIVRLGVHTTANYFRPEAIDHALENDLGRREIPEEILWTLREVWRYDASGLWLRTTPVSWYFERGTWLLVGCLFLLVPLVIVNLWRAWPTPARGQAALLAVVGTGLVLAHVLLVPVALYRYLHPLPCFAVLAVAALKPGPRSPGA